MDSKEARVCQSCHQVLAIGKFAFILELMEVVWMKMMARKGSPSCEASEGCVLVLACSTLDHVLTSVFRV